MMINACHKATTADNITPFRGISPTTQGPAYRSSKQLLISED